MSEITIEQIIKIIVGISVVLAVVGGVYLAFKYNIFDFFKNLPVGDTGNIILGLSI